MSGAQRKLGRRLAPLLLLGLLVATSVASLPTSRAQTEVTTVTIPTGFPGGLAYDSAKGEIFVAVAVSPGATANTPNVYVISDNDDQIVASLHINGKPQGIFYDPAKGELFVSNCGIEGSDPGNLSVISDTTDRVVANISVTAPPGDTSPVCPTTGAYNPSKGEIIVEDEFTNAVYVISDTTDQQVAEFSHPANTTYGRLGDTAGGVAYDPAKGELFLVDPSANEVSVISASDYSSIANVSLQYPAAIAYDSAKGEVFVDSAPGVGSSAGVSVISDSSNQVVATVNVGGYPAGLAYDPVRGDIFVADSILNEVTVLSDTGNQFVTNVTVGPTPNSVIYDSGKGEMFVTTGSGSIDIISDAALSSGPTEATSTSVAQSSSVQASSSASSSISSQTSSGPTSSSSSGTSISVSWNYLGVVAVNAAILFVLAGVAAMTRGGRPASFRSTSPARRL